MFRTIFAFSAITLMLTSCGIPNPPLQVRTLAAAGCVDSHSTEAWRDPSSLYFAASNLPDCREKRVNFTNFRGSGVFLGQSIISGNVATHDVAHHTQFLDKTEWLASIREEATKSGGLLVFIHGFNNSYEDAVSRAELVRRLYETEHPAVVLVWPSRQKAQSYIYDEASVAWAQDYMNQALSDLVKQTSDITIVAHSMGGRAAIAAVEHVDLTAPEEASHIRKIALVAPDIDRHRVLRSGGAVERLLNHGRDVIVYTSQRDWPIRASRILHGYSRLGSSDCRYSVDYERRSGGRYGKCHRIDPANRERLRVVETSFARGESFLRHANVFDTCVGRDDLRAFVQDLEDPPWRKIETNVADDGLIGWYLDPTLHRELRGTC